MNILIVDEHPAVFEGLRLLAERRWGASFTHAPTSAIARQSIEAGSYAYIVADILIDRDDTLNLLSGGGNRLTVPVIMYTAAENPTFIARAVALSVAAYLSKRSPVASLIAAVENHRDRIAIDESDRVRTVRQLLGSESPSPPTGPFVLTNREHQVLRHLGLGLSNREIGCSLSISVETVKEHVQNILRKNGCQRPHLGCGSSSACGFGRPGLRSSPPDRPPQSSEADDGRNRDPSSSPRNVAIDLENNPSGSTVGPDHPAEPIHSPSGTDPTVAPKRILVCGATGYVGGRLVRRLLSGGHHVRCFVRSPAKLHKFSWHQHEQLEVVQGDLEDADQTDAATDGIEVAYYLVHSMVVAGDEYERRDRVLAENFVAAADRGGIGRIIYLGGLGETGPGLSRHLRSRREVADILRSGSAEVTVFRAAMIIGSGSASFRNPAVPRRTIARHGDADLGSHANATDRDSRRAALFDRLPRRLRNRRPNARHRLPRGGDLPASVQCHVGRVAAPPTNHHSGANFVAPIVVLLDRLRHAGQQQHRSAVGRGASQSDGVPQ